ncbi:hypothetical protein J1TS5_61560 [Paenibacillus macerans]|uniref:phage tail tape measure protein n=1 Tax=Paenibacillus macerans TaxID=44252 RepID=UPI001B10B74D|nr:phage tail tape measure protein [Paenibacillus macerans]GIP13986.1 hypothetical protein J1TS5_61560 [Paenibacillus macerans]
MAIDIVANLRLLDGVTRPLRKAMSSFAKFGVAATGMSVAVGGVALAADSVKKAMNFEAQMSSIKALTGATDKQMQQVQALALEQGAATKYSAMEAAQAIEELLKAGMTTAQVQGGGLNAALNLATAGGLELAEAAETMATSMNAFKKDGLSASQTADILAGTANAAATDIRNIGYAIASAGGVADMAGVSFRDLNAAIGLMSNDGLKSGSDAGTSFKSFLMFLQPQTKKATELFKKLGIGVGKANKFFENGKIRSLDEIAEVLREATKGMTDQDRTATFLDAFGTDAVKAATTLYKAGAKGVKKFYSEMSTTTALKVAEEKMNNAAGAVEQFQGAIETLQISALLPTMPILKDFANAAAEFVGKYTPQITAAMERLVSKAKNYLSTHFTNNPEFQKLTTLESQVKFVLDDLTPVMGDALKLGGQLATNVIAGLASEMTKGILNNPVLATTLGVAALIASPTPIGLTVALSVTAPAWFKALVEGTSPVIRQKEEFNRQFSAWEKGIEDATKREAEGKPAPGAAEGWYFSAPEPKSWGEKALEGFKDGLSDFTSWVKHPTISSLKDYSNNTGVSSSKGSFGKGHSSGLDRVPYNGYPARLHKDETVLTRGEAAEYREQQRGGGGGRPVTINLGGVTINNDTDVDAICAKIAKALAYA